MSVRYPARTPRRNHDGVMALVYLGIMAAVLGWAWANNKSVDRQVDECITQGGTPVVTGGWLFDDFKACVVEVQP